MSTDATDASDYEPIEIDHSPTKVSAVAAIGAGIIAALTSAPFAILALPLGMAGAGAIAAGLLIFESRTWIGIGTGALFLSILVSGGFGTPVELLLVSTIGAMLAWDLGHNAIGLGEQIGRHSATQRNEVIHAAFTTVVAVFAAVIGYGIYAVAGGGQPVAALAMLLLGLVFVIWSIRT